MTPLLAPGYRALLAPECLLRGAIEARVLSGVPVAIGQEGLQPHINTDVRVSTRRWRVICTWLRLAHNERVPVSVSTQDQMHRFGSPLYRAMHLDLERFTDLGGDDEVLLVFVQVRIFAVLPELERVPLITLFETRKPDTSNAMFFSREKTFETLRKPICQHLYCRGWDVFTLPLKGCQDHT